MLLTPVVEHWLERGQWLCYLHETRLDVTSLEVRTRFECFEENLSRRVLVDGAQEVAQVLPVGGQRQMGAVYLGELTVPGNSKSFTSDEHYLVLTIFIYDTKYVDFVLIRMQL